MVDRARRLASPFGGPALLRKFYKHVQLAESSMAGRACGPCGSGVRRMVDGNFRNPADLVISASYTRCTCRCGQECCTWGGGVGRER